MRNFSKPMLDVALQYLVTECKFFPAEHNFTTLNNCKYCKITLHFSHHIECFSPKATINITLGLLHLICILILHYCAVKSGRIVNLTYRESSSATDAQRVSHEEIREPGSEPFGRLNLLSCWQGWLCLQIPF